ncbi:hypothetical protein BTJ39_24235 [Izhakiella australiensis]|uniref:Uncharacterized protein n=1 Tax=Izhakiella australiensis TaxID=1926881 RepID=A0A1S8Y4C9_9GAMM|nr:hypothetical protein [Izhakiella australiensis]OON33523.1 hypothetical protein BTJ39_24235 [Izhakiella australiensis]
MSKWIYPEVINELIVACNEFFDGKITVQEIQQKFYDAEIKIVAIDEKWLRASLADAENEIELLTYTVEDHQLKLSVIPVVQKILDQIK